MRIGVGIHEIDRICFPPQTNHHRKSLSMCTMEIEPTGATSSYGGSQHRHLANSEFKLPEKKLNSQLTPRSRSAHGFGDEDMFGTKVERREIVGKGKSR